jgi:hypothetical protein
MRKDWNLKPIIDKNLISHKNRNSKTAIMFVVCLSFLIFAGSTFKLLGTLIVSELEIAVGADLYAQTLTDKADTFIDEMPIS